MRRRSLTWRLISRLLLLEIVLLTVITILLMVWLDPVDYRDVYWYVKSEPMLEASVVHAPDGSLLLSPTPEFQAYLQARPGMEIAAMELASGRALPGSSPALVADMRALGTLGVREVNFAVARPGDVPRSGFGTTTSTQNGTILFYLYNGQVRTDDIVHVVQVEIHDIGRYAVPALTIMSLVGWWVIRVTLAPLRAAGVQAADIDFRHAGARLPEDARVPRELFPLVHGVNRALDRLQEGFKRQQRFTANAAHEIRTPLSILRARIDSLDGIAGQGELRRDAQRITTLVDQMLAIARLEQNGATFETFDLGEAVGALVSEFAPLAADGDRMLAFLPPPRTLRLHANARALASAVGNLIDNALHAEPCGGTVIVAVTEDGAVVVADHGPGIPPEDRDLVFEPFWRRDESRVGTGLGLAIVREIAVLHRGAVTLTETPGGGATFRLTVPALR